MTTEIDLREILARTVGSAHADLVTRPTGARIRDSIEAALSDRPAGTPVVLDFSSVRVLDCSCADEVVAKLLIGRREAQGAPSAGLVIRGLTEIHAEEIDHVLRRRRLALVAEEPDGHARLLGEVDAPAAAAFALLADLGEAAEEDLAMALAWTADEARRVLEALVVAGVALRSGDRYQPLRAA